MGIKILNGGLLTTLQDLGRTGYRKDGVPISGAMDTYALRIGNLLLGNAEGEAGIECTLSGPRIEIFQPQLIALTGADCAPKLNGKPVRMWAPTVVQPGDVLHFGAVIKGCRSYLCVKGGFDVEPVLGSRATYLKAGIGGYQGRALLKGDLIPFRCKPGPAGIPDPSVAGSWSVSRQLYPQLSPSVIRVLQGPEYEQFTAQSIADFCTMQFQVTAQSDRMGCRLAGPALALKTKTEMYSSAVSFGTIQVSSNAQPILLAADHQTTGGYPRLAQVITADLPVVGQLQSGQSVRFELISEKYALKLLQEREQHLLQLKQTLRFKNYLL